MLDEASTFSIKKKVMIHSWKTAPLGTSPAFKIPLKLAIDNFFASTCRSGVNSLLIAQSNGCPIQPAPPHRTFPAKIKGHVTESLPPHNQNRERH